MMTVKIHSDLVKIEGSYCESVSINGSDLVFARIDMNSDFRFEHLRGYHNLPKIYYIFASGENSSLDIPSDKELENAYQIELKRMNRETAIDKISK